MTATTPTVTLILPQATAGLSASNTLVFGANPAGKFGTGKFGADGPQEVTITGDVQNISIRRGRSNTLDRPEAGTCTVTVRNDRANAGDYDIFNTSSPYYPYLASSQIRVDIGAVTIYTGLVKEIQLSEDIPELSVVSFNCVDATSFLANNGDFVIYDEGLYRSDYTSEQQFQRVVETCGGTWVGTDVGLMNTVRHEDGTTFMNALDFAAMLESGERGIFWCDVDGAFTWKNRNTLVTQSSAMTISDDPAETIKYAHIDRGSFQDRLWNDITLHTINRTNDDTTGDVRDTAERSIGLYGRRTKAFIVDIDIDGVGFYPLADVLPLFMADYANPYDTVNSVTIHVARYSALVQALILLTDIGACITTERTPPGESQLTSDYLVVGIEHSIAPRVHDMTFNVVPCPTVDFP